MHKFTDFQQSEKQSNPKAFEILDRPVLETLHYASSQYKWSDAATNASAINSPYKLQESFKISQSQFEWITLNERSRSQAWRDLEGIFEKKVNQCHAEKLSEIFIFHFVPLICRRGTI